eukprot:CAMPEP_0203841824 /NCGR_PEP_ID=MMETSP0359-20131031/1626_1 /ASSEMBLY_ACC=CAM_ASM_000338 /TAXON_ID=268821 /ORGANISM="Scrippsiella Hangoei, Strain SHTV-5" /LENGTH=269 /DNA_ID=CAMNT_0050756317 /DNA_START=586 /DNA_END=1394 /DNA_ORIENTATION=-
MKAAQGHLVEFSSGVVVHFPLEHGDVAGGAAEVHDADRGIVELDLDGDIQDVNLDIELVGRIQSRAFLVHRGVIRTGHLLLVQTLDVQAPVVVRICKQILFDQRALRLIGKPVMAHLHVRDRVRGQEDDLFAELQLALLHASGQHIADTLHDVDVEDWRAHQGADRALGHTEEFFQHVVDGATVERLSAAFDDRVLTPVHLLRLFREVVTQASGDRQQGYVLLDRVLLPADREQHALHLVGRLVIADLHVNGGVAVHPVHAGGDMLGAQ